MWIRRIPTRNRNTGLQWQSELLTTYLCVGPQGVSEGETRSPESATTTFSDGEGEESEADEGIHLPRRHHRPAPEVRHSLSGYRRRG
jgi:hypothetical protein